MRTLGTFYINAWLKQSLSVATAETVWFPAIVNTGMFRDFTRLWATKAGAQVTSECSPLWYRNKEYMYSSNKGNATSRVEVKNTLITMWRVLVYFGSAMLNVNLSWKKKHSPVEMDCRYGIWTGWRRQDLAVENKYKILTQWYLLPARIGGYILGYSPLCSRGWRQMGILLITFGGRVVRRSSP